MLLDAAGLWSNWVNSGLMRPKDYDREVSDAILCSLAESGSKWQQLPALLRDAKWDSRDLIREIYPILASFSGMLDDLLTLYARVGATRTNSTSLRIQYEFEKGDPIDDLLTNFAETTQRLSQCTTQIIGIQYPTEGRNAWESPISKLARKCLPSVQPTELGAQIAGVDLYNTCEPWRSNSAVPQVEIPPTEHYDTLQRVTSMHLQVIRGVLGLCQLHSQDGCGPSEDTYSSQSESIRLMLHDASDYWAFCQIGLLHLTPRLISYLDDHEASSLLADQQQWLERFIVPITSTTDQLVDEIEDVLQLPYWGRRHELYSAWITACMDRALDGRLEFDVSDGVLAFPFRATLLARLPTATGEVELWTEKRFPAKGELGGGRKNAIQPDYAFVEAGRSGSVLIAVEAKQYLRASCRNPGEAARDYARNLPGATVIVTAHGPIGRTVGRYLNAAERQRVQFHSHVRPFSQTHIDRFCNEIAGLLPPPPPAPVHSGDLHEKRNIFQDQDRRLSSTSGDSPTYPSRVGIVSLVWNPDVEDLDLHLHTEAPRSHVYFSYLQAPFAHLDADCFNGGPESAELFDVGKAIHVEVGLYSDDVDTLGPATPRVFITTSHGRFIFAPSESAVSTRTWRVATVDSSGSITPIDSTEGHEVHHQLGT